MHEMSLVEALLTQIDAHVPAGGVVRRVHLRAGPLHGIEPEAMQWAWAIAVEATGWPGAVEVRDDARVAILQHSDEPNLG